MTENEKREFYEMVKGILQVYGRPANEDVLGAWWGVLKLWPLELVRSAMDVFVRDSLDPPAPASVVKFINELTHG